LIRSSSLAKISKPQTHRMYRFCKNWI